MSLVLFLLLMVGLLAAWCAMVEQYFQYDDMPETEARNRIKDPLVGLDGGRKNENS